MDKQENFDYESFRQQALSGLSQGKELGGKDGVLAPLIKDLLEAALQGELSAHLEQSRPNRANGGKAKRVKTAHRLGSDWPGSD